MKNESVSVGVLLDSRSIHEWQKRCLEKLLSSEYIDADIELIILNEESIHSSFESKLKRFVLEFSLWKLFVAYRKFSAHQPWYEETTPISELDMFDDVEVMSCKPVPASGVGNELPEGSIDALSETDFGIRFGFGILKGDALTAPQYGVLSYHHGDLTEYRGRPPGFYEFLKNESTAGVTVQRLNETLDAGSIATMAQVDISTAESWGEVKSRLFDKGTDLLPEAVYRCKYEPEKVNPPDKTGDLYTIPSNKHTVVYLYKRVRNII